MTQTIPIIGVRCHSCSHFYSELEIIRIGESITRCFKCQEAHTKALEMVAMNAPPPGCAHCKATFAQIAARDPGDTVSMALCMVDGVYVPLCDLCERAYVEKRRDLYGETRFGWERKLR